MTPWPDRGLLLVAFALLCAGNGRWLVAPAAWLAPVFLLLFLHSQPLRRGLALAFLAQLLAFFVNWRGMIPVPGAWYYLVAGIYAAFYFLPFLLHRVLAPRIPGLRSTLVFPVAWVGVELLLQKLVTPYGSWASLAYTQVGFLPLLQLAAVTGMSGIHFMMTWCAAVAAWAWRQRTAFSRARLGVVTCGAVFLGLLLWGQWRIVAAPEEAPLLRVAALTPSAALDRQLQAEVAAVMRSAGAGEASLAGVEEIADRLNEDLLARTRREARAGADVVVWSEHAARVTRQTEPRLIEEARQIAGSFGVSLILGIGLWDPGARPSFENKAILIDAGGGLADAYFKARPIVGRESGLIDQGDARIATAEAAWGPFALAICHDLDFPDLLRDAGRSGTFVIFAPSSDWEAVTPLHAHMAILRAVENGASLVRPTSSGLSLVVDPLGRTVASQLDHGADGNALTFSLPLVRLRTVYPVLGDAFAWANLVGLAVVLAHALVGAVRRRGRDASVRHGGQGRQQTR